jgi:hypothetical protein
VAPLLVGLALATMAAIAALRLVIAPAGPDPGSVAPPALDAGQPTATAVAAPARAEAHGGATPAAAGPKAVNPAGDAAAGHGTAPDSDRQRPVRRAPGEADQSRPGRVERARRSPPASPAPPTPPAAASSGRPEAVTTAAAGPAGVPHPRVAIVIDDCGQSLALMERAVAIRAPLTFAVLPRLSHSRRSSELAAAAGHEVILHQPMEPEDLAAGNVGAGALWRGMSRRQVEDVLEANLEDVPDAVGLNNHMGSRATADRTLMERLMAAIRGASGRQAALYFLDSRTTPDTVARLVAEEAGIPTAERATFLDNVEEPGLVVEQLALLVAEASQTGEAIGIGHLKAVTLGVLERELPRLRAQGVRFVPVSSLVR